MSTSAPTWAGRLPRTDAESLGRVRLQPGVEALLAGEALWVRGAVESEAAMKSLPWQERFEIISGNLLRPVGARLPVGRLPSGNWTALALLLKPELPRPGFGGKAPPRLPIGWVAATQEREPGVLLTSSTTWLAFVRTASNVRLRPLKFAQNASGEIAILGAPLPSVPGERFYLADGVALPLGWDPSPRLSAESWARLLDLPAGDLPLIRREGMTSVILAHAWQAASRGAARLSLLASA